MAKFEGIIRDLEQERARIDAAIQALKGLGTASTNHNQPTRRQRRRMSAAAKARIAAAQRRRWAKWKKQQRG